MKRVLCLGLFIAGFVGLAASAHADTANFQANCTWNASHTYFTCIFDGQRPASNPSSCSNGATPQYSWNFDDGSSSTSYSTSSTAGHLYYPPPPGQYGYWPTLSIICDRLDGTQPTFTYAQRYMCVSGFGVYGCIQVNGTWN